MSKRRRIRELKGRAHRVYSLAALPNYTHFQALASGCNDGSVQLWDTTTGNMVVSLGDEPTEVDHSRREERDRDERDRTMDDALAHGVATASDRLENNAQRFFGTVNRRVSNFFSRLSRKHEKDKS